jgi:hypothetical protein
MDIKLVQFSIIVVGKDHNPSLINPDFLERLGIIDENWGWSRAGDSITTPPFATVPYDSGVTVTVETNKLQVIDQAGLIPLESHVTEIVKRYIEVLPHIPYQAVGINFSGAVTMADPGIYLKKHFFREGKWDTAEHPLESVGLKFMYPLAAGRAVLTMDEAHKVGNKDEEAILVNVNFHRDCVKAESANDQIANFIQNIAVDWDYYLNLVSNVLDDD